MAKKKDDEPITLSKALKINFPYTYVYVTRVFAVELRRQWLKECKKHDGITKLRRDRAVPFVRRIVQEMATIREDDSFRQFSLKKRQLKDEIEAARASYRTEISLIAALRTERATEAYDDYVEHEKEDASSSSSSHGSSSSSSSSHGSSSSGSFLSDSSSSSD